MEKNTIIALCLGVFLMLSFVVIYSIPVPASAASDKPIELKVGYMMPAQGIDTIRGYVPWGKMVEEATHGKVKIVHYPSESLFTTKEAITAVESGLADMSISPLGYFSGRFNLTEVMFLPFLLKSRSPRVNSGIMQRLYDTVPEVQKEWSTMKLLCIYTTGPNFIASKKPIRNMGDLKGLRVRAAGKDAIKLVKDLGASPVTTAAPDVYEAAAKGVIDATLLIPIMVIDWKLYEVFPYWTDIVLWPSICFTTMNLKKWNSLPSDVQAGIMSVSGLKGAQFTGEHAFEVKEDIEKEIKASGKKFERVDLDKGELEKWKKRFGEPMWKEWVADKEKMGLAGQKVLDAVRKLVDKYSE